MTFETNYLATIYFILWAIFSTFAGIRLSSLLPWSPAARIARLPLATGVALAPFLLAFATIVALLAAPGASYTTHLAIIAIILSASAALGGLAEPASNAAHADKVRYRMIDLVLFGALAAIALVIFITAVATPLYNNDPLEYAMSGRILFETRNLYIYPPIQPGLVSSGFFGPWSHPPLFVALIYFADILQGATADNVTKLISPWFAYAAAALAFGIGALKDRSVGSLAAIFVLTTPLIFQSSTIAHIDTLPLAGFALALAAITGFQPRLYRSALLQGALVGVALWTHSQALLFIPVMLAAVVLYFGWKDIRALVTYSALSLTATLAVASGPYIHNYLLFGTPITDLPEVFALTSLHWDEYFRLSRGYASWPDRIQFGILKAWTTPDFGLTYWLMALGVMWFGFRAFKAVKWSKLRKGQLDFVPDQWLLAPLGALICYWGGVVVSTLLGFDLMIRNDRYQIVTLPAAALFAAYAVHMLYRSLAIPAAALQLPWRIIRIAAVIGAVFVLWNFARTTSYIVIRDLRLAWQGPGWLQTYFDLAEAIRLKTPSDATVLALRPADMYFTQRRMMSYLDPRLVPFYKEQETNKAFKILQDLGVDYIQLPNYSTPTVYNSRLQEIAGDPRYTTIVAETSMGQLYLLKENPNAKMGVAINVDDKACWTQTKNTNRSASTALCDGAPSVLATRRPYNRRLQSAIVMSGPGESSNTVGAPPHLLVEENLEYRAEISLSGNAYASISVHFYDASGQQIAERPLGDRAVVDTPQHQKFIRRFITVPKTTAIRFSIEHRGSSSLRMNGVTLIPTICRSSATSRSQC